MRIALVLSLVLLGACASRHPITTIPPEPPSRVTDIVKPTDLVAIGFCSVDATWNQRAPEDQWFAIRIDGEQQSWPGPLVKISENCFSTPKAFTFAAGSHTVEVQLVTPGPLVVPVEEGPPSTCVIGQDCYGASGEILTVVSTEARLTGPPPAVANGTVVR